MKNNHSIKQVRQLFLQMEQVSQARSSDEIERIADKLADDDSVRMAAQKCLEDGTDAYNLYDIIKNALEKKNDLLSMTDITNLTLEVLKICQKSVRLEK